MSEPARRLRVALVVPGFSASDADWCIPGLLTLVRRVVERADLEILTLRYPPTPQRYVVSGARVRSLGGIGIRGVRKAGLLARAVAAVTEAHREHPYDVLHAMWADEPGAVAVAAGWRLRRPVVVSVMGGELVHFPAIGYGAGASRVGRLAARWALRRATVVTVGSASLRAAVRSHTGADVRLAPLGVDLARFSPSGPRARLAGPLRLLQVASLSPVKDHAVMLEALRIVRTTVPVHLHLVGDGELRDELGRRARALGVSEHVTFHGSVPHHALPPYYRAADLVVVSSTYESQCMAALEAAACGRPLVGTSVGIVPELEGVPVVPPGNPHALSHAIRVLSVHHARRAALGRALRKTVEARFDVEHTSSQLRALYEEVARR